MVPEENVYDRGQVVRLSTSFTVKSSGLAIDPTVVSVSVKDPAGTLTTRQYLVDAAVIKDSVGNYHYDLSLDAAGRYTYRWFSTGTGQAAKENALRSKVAVAV